VTLTLCGHSLGGAIALNFPALIRRYILHLYPCWDDRHFLVKRIQPGATYTFGAPRIGKGRVWNYIHRPHYRLIVCGDWVPKLPPCLTDDYEATYLEEPSQSVTQPKDVPRKILKALCVKFRSKIPFRLSAHDIENYIEAIRQKMEAKNPKKVEKA